VVVGAAILFVAPKLKKGKVNEPTPAPATPLAVTPNPEPVKPTPTPTTPPPVETKGVTVTELAPFANRGAIAEKLFLVGEFRISSALDRTVIARPTARELTSAVRVSARFPQGARLPAEGSTVQWTKETSLKVREVRKGNDGQLNIEVEQGR
jgi:hypothetical protein